MPRLLACVDIPHAALQILLRDMREWRNEAVVLLDRDEANGRIIDLNREAAGLGLNRGMLYGPSLGIHRNLKGAVLEPKKCRDFLKDVRAVLRDFSPSVEGSQFEEGCFWLDGSGLKTMFGTVRRWMEQVDTALGQYGLDIGLAAGRGRFSTWAAARLRPMGRLNIFSSPDEEIRWVENVPVTLIPMNDDALRLFRRLDITTIGDALHLNTQDIARRLSPEAAEVVHFIRNEQILPLQSEPEEISGSWTIRPEEPWERASDLMKAGEDLIDRCLASARLSGSVVIVIRIGLYLTGGGCVDASVKPAHPTRDRTRLIQLFALRIGYLKLDGPVQEVRAHCVFGRPNPVQSALFETDHHRRDADAVLGNIRAERGEVSVRSVRLVDDSLPTRRFQLVPWDGFPSGRSATEGTYGTSGVPKDSFRGSCVGERTLVRRIRLIPRPSQQEPDPGNRVEYSGGWWNRPYRFEFGYRNAGGSILWLQRGHQDSGDGGAAEIGSAGSSGHAGTDGSSGDERWELIGRVE